MSRVVWQYKGPLGVIANSCSANWPIAVHEMEIPQRLPELSNFGSLSSNAGGFIHGLRTVRSAHELALHPDDATDQMFQAYRLIIMGEFVTIVHSVQAPYIMRG